MKNLPQQYVYQAIFNNLPDIELVKVFRTSRLEQGMSSYTHTHSYDSADTKEDRKIIRKHLESLGYYGATYTGARIMFLDHSTENYCKAMVTSTAHGGTVTITVNGDIDEVDRIAQWGEENFKSSGSKVRTATRITDTGVVKFETTFLREKDVQLAKDVFYPWLSISLLEYYKAFMESSESVLVLFGPPGTGKSTFLRSLIVSNQLEAMLAYSAQVVSSPLLVDTFFSSTADVLAYEDIDLHLSSREGGNQLMSSLLNASEGIVKRNNRKQKVIFSTNLSSIDKIDPALLRVGRCFDILEFRELTRKESIAVLEDVAAPPKDFSGKERWSLAEVLNEKVQAQQVINRFARKPGFY